MWQRTLANFEPLMMAEYGELHSDKGSPHGGSLFGGGGFSDFMRVSGHFLACSTEHAIDFIEMVLNLSDWCAKNSGIVDAINRVFRQEGVGFEATRFAPIESAPNSRLVSQIIRKTDEVAHQQIVRPTLDLLADSRFRTANQEFLDGLAHYRHGRFEDAITSVGKSYESTMKTICSLKNWQFDQNDTTSKLSDVLKVNGLIFDFYIEPFKFVGTIRNRLGAHGKGQAPAYTVEQHHVEHMIHLCAANMLMMVRSAAL